MTAAKTSHDSTPAPGGTRSKVDHTLCTRATRTVDDDLTEIDAAYHKTGNTGTSGLTEANDTARTVYRSIAQDLAQRSTRAVSATAASTLRDAARTFSTIAEDVSPIDRAHDPRADSVVHRLGTAC